ncbi:MAG: glucosamine-6-phosphate isomerase [Deltaproteobacteria bacterium]
MNFNSNVEKFFFEKQANKKISTKIPYIRVENFPKLGLLTSLRFLEWVDSNPDGVISLPTGKTPEHFIKWTQFFLENWKDNKNEAFRKENGLIIDKKPDLRGLHFVQIDEFFPINPSQHNSFYYYVNKYYIDGFGFDPNKALLINSEDISLSGNKNYKEIFPDLIIDLTLRYRQAINKTEKTQQESIFKIDQWCNDYEDKIRKKGGIGFFLGGIGPDGHIAFNILGSDHHSTTRLTPTNFPTQAVAAGDLGGIKVAKNRHVITIGLETITYNQNTLAIIFAAGDAKAKVVKEALEKDPDVLYPATCLQKLPNARFYITQGAGITLEDSVDFYYENGHWDDEKKERAVIDMLVKIDKYAHHITMEDILNDKYVSKIPNVSEKAIQDVIESVKHKIKKGITRKTNTIFYHSGPHHDDIQLALMPRIVHDMRDASNKFHFTVMTSGFTAVTNEFVYDSLLRTRQFIEDGKIEMIYYPDFFYKGFKLKYDKDVNHFLNKIASNDIHGQKRALAHRIVRIITEIYGIKHISELIGRISDLLHEISSSYDGEKNSPEIQRFKGMIREFEEELVWGHYGIKTENIHHLRLGFYKGDTFTESPETNRDVLPVLEQLRKIEPNIISVAFDPEGSGPDTHYKVLQATAEAVRLWSKEKDLSELRIIGYRNVWYRFHPAEANVFVPVSLNKMAELDSSFSTCYLTQVDAPFPSYELDGKFSTLAQQIWVKQREVIQLVLGKDYFYLNENQRIRGTHGFIFYKEMKTAEFLGYARELQNMMEGAI